MQSNQLSLLGKMIVQLEITPRPTLRDHDSNIKSLNQTGATTNNNLKNIVTAVERTAAMATGMGG